MKNTYTLLRTLHRKDIKQLMEWSIQFSRDEFISRHKPTIYLYPDSQKETFRELGGLLRCVGTPEKLVKIQEECILKSMYQGIRIPESEGDDKCLYIHEEAYSYIHSYRWKDRENFDRCFYRFGLNDTIKQNMSFIHPELKEFYNVLKNGKGYNRLFGNWIQENEGRIREIYLSFPSRPTLKWVLDSFQPILKDEVYYQLTQFKDLPIKNIGFDSVVEKKPKVTLYFSILLSNYFPLNHTQLVQLTHDYHLNRI
ncbi:hypothetical protein [Chryseobacterium sp. SL1]|uniref:hypothetical protein n=1 Tax=Chryseobacterium sp. SL1 TaxID=2995159 RepID=UPI00227670B8|nr:hypothetical protein [Chryseobacterium sp. SL1]MCY1663859.1 hypothetical protein [Chryseobacterium sp. SL1]